MANFVGLTVLVTLKQGTVVQGFVRAIDANTASLVLQDAYLPNTGQQVGNWTVQGPSIADLQVVDKSKPTPQTQQNTTQPNLQQSTPAPQAQQDQFVDPAILSYGRKSGTPAAPNFASQKVQNNTPQEAPSTPVKAIPAAAAAKLPRKNTSPFVGAPKQPAGNNNNKSLGRLRGGDAAATLKAPFSNLDINNAAEQEHLDDTDDPTVRRASLTKTRTGKPMDDIPPTPDNTKKSRRKKKRELGAQTAGENEADAEPSPEVVRRAANGAFRGKGWRQTPMLQDQPIVSSPQKLGKQSASGPKRSRKQRAMEMEAQNNGWATEDATDIQDMPEFDFEENLSKFDKRTVFDQIRTEDTTADEERLVNFNRVARPGTYGGKNLHPTENVLESPKIMQLRTSTQGSDTDEPFDRESNLATKQTRSRTSSRRPPFRSGSGVADDTASVKDFARAARSLRVAYAGSSSHGAAGSPNPGRFTPPESPATSQIIPGAHFRIASTNRSCPTIMPAGMAAIEEVAETEFGLTTEIMTENAGRGIAEVAMATFGSSTAKRSTRENSRVDPRPWALIIAGNHRSGARALAACRHLRSRNIRTLTCILGFDRQTVELEREIRKQAEILVKMGGYVRGWADTKNYLTREGQPDLIIDALLAASRPFDALGSEDQRAVLDIVNWTNKSGGAKAITLSVDMPCGINGSTGEPALIDSTTAEILQLHSNHIVCIGAPRIGLLRALQKTAVLAAASVPTTFSVELLNAQIWVVDIGVEKAWKRSGLAGSRGVKFGNEWVVPVKLVEGGLE